MAPQPSGVLALQALHGVGVEHLFTLSGGHLFPLYDGCRQTGVRITDFRHEQSATFAAEALGKLTRRPQVAALTAGPGVTNGMSAVASAAFGGSPLLVLGGRAPAATWGQGSLQEIDHVAFMTPVTKHAATATGPEDVAGAVLEAHRLAGAAHRGPTFVDIPMDVIFTPAEEATVPTPAAGDPVPLDAQGAAGVAALLQDAERPVIVGGTDVWFEAAWPHLRHLVETVQVPVVLNGMGRGLLPADHPQVISRARGTAFGNADLVVVIGTPLDFRLGFGRFGDARVAHVADHPDRVAGHADLAAAASGPLADLLTGLAEAAGGPTGDRAAARATWLAQVAAAEAAARADEPDLASDAHPIHPARVYGALRQVLDRDAVVIGDGGDFVSYAGRYVDSFTPGCWLDPGPYGCLGTGMGYAAAARLAHPDRQVVALLGDGAAGFSLMDAETLARHRLPVVMVLGNNGIWALEKFPMQAVYDGWDAAADLQPGLRYDDVVAALGGAGETVDRAADLVPALRRGFAAGVPYLINVLTDPAVAYPRRTLLA